jgi:hypothetical protein
MLLRLGAWFTLLTVTVMVSESSPPFPSLTVKATVYEPASLKLGVKLKMLPLRLTVPDETGPLGLIVAE